MSSAYAQVDEARDEIIHCLIRAGAKIQVLMAKFSHDSSEGGHGAEGDAALSQHNARSTSSEFCDSFASQARNDKGGTPLHTAAGTANKAGVLKLIELRADVNAKNDRGQQPYDCCKDSNADIKAVIAAAGGRASDTWDGRSGRSQDPNGRKGKTYPDRASPKRLQRAKNWRDQSGK